MRKLFIGSLLISSLFLCGCNSLMEIAVDNLDDTQSTLCDVDAAYTAVQNARKSGAEMRSDYGSGCKNAGQIRSVYQTGYVGTEK
jgi:uncharacterized protein YcfL